MANYCNNYLQVDGPYEDVKRFFDECKTEVTDKEGVKSIKPLSFEKHVPVGDVPDWYEQRCSKWGTKWDVNNVDIYSEDVIKHEDGSGEIQYSFDTAWAPPTIWLSKVTELFPMLHFQLNYDESGNGLYGKMECVNGEATDLEMTKHEYLMENSEEYPSIVESINNMSQEDLIKCFASIKSFSDCCHEEEEWPPYLCEKDNWDEVDMYDMYELPDIIVPRIEFQNLPLFMNVSWGYSNGDEIFKRRMKEGK